MGERKGLSIVNDCSGERKGYFIDESVHIDTVTILDKDYPVYFPGEKVKISVDYTSKLDISMMSMRMTVLSGDRTVIGLATTSPCITVKEGSNNTDIELDLSWLAPGKYYVRLTAYSVNDYGVKLERDVVEDAFSFEKIQGDSNNRMEWNHEWWGYMAFPELQVNND
jgi:hypothetical protein